MPARNEIFQNQTPMTISRAELFICDRAEELFHFNKEEIYASIVAAKV